MTITTLKLGRKLRILYRLFTLEGRPLRLPVKLIDQSTENTKQAARSPRRTTIGYRKTIREEREEWIRSQVRERDEAARKAREAEIAAVMAELEKNKPA